jgi:hypothetical protein
VISLSVTTFGIQRPLSSHENLLKKGFAPDSGSSNQAGSSGGTNKTEALDDLLQRLGIEEDGSDDLVFEDETDVPKEAIKWMALARVHTTNYFSLQTFERHMRIAWSPTREVKIK